MNSVSSLTLSWGRCCLGSCVNSFGCLNSNNWSPFGEDVSHFFIPSSENSFTTKFLLHLQFRILWQVGARLKKMRKLKSGIKASSSGRPSLLMRLNEGEAKPWIPRSQVTASLDQTLQCSGLRMTSRKWIGMRKCIFKEQCLTFNTFLELICNDWDILLPSVYYYV